MACIFEPSRSRVIKSNSEIDQAIKLKTPPDSMVIIHSDYTSNDKFVYTKPIAAYMNKIDTILVQETSEQTLSQKTGRSSWTEVSHDAGEATASSVNSSIAAGILGCNKYLDVTTGFDDNTTIAKEGNATWNQTLDPETYSVYQNCILYAFKLKPASGSMSDIMSFSMFSMSLDAAGVKVYTIGGDQFFFISFYRNDHFVVKGSDEYYEPVAFDALIAYVNSPDAQNKWNP